MLLFVNSVGLVFYIIWCLSLVIIVVVACVLAVSGFWFSCLFISGVTCLWLWFVIISWMLFVDLFWVGFFRYYGLMVFGCLFTW